MYKAGDKFEVVGNRGDSDSVKIGDIVTATNYIHAHGGCFSGESSTEIYADIEGANIGVSRTVRPLRTEAEKRGAKFGVGGVLKYTGERLIFVSDDSCVWRVIKEGMSETQVYMSFEIRLDHEPEYKEIPFSEATHEQRMDARNLWYAGSPVVQISHFPGCGYAFKIKDDFEIRTNTKSLTIRIPT